LIRPSLPPYLYIIKNKSINPQKPKAMKTLKITTVISLVMFLFGITAINARPVYSNNDIQPVLTIRYQVHIHGMNDLSRPMPKIYVVITDERGHQVAPAQVFIMGISVYNFNEAGPVTGTRQARLIVPLEGGDNFPIYLTPDTKRGTFKNGNIYQYNLYPFYPRPVPIPEPIPVKAGKAN
jgi:hypothetical protein